MQYCRTSVDTGNTKLSLPLDFPDCIIKMATLSPNFRNTIDQEVYKWVIQQNKKSKVVTQNAIRQKAYEIGQEYDPNFKASLNWYNNWKKRYEYDESPEAEALKHKKRSYTAAFKLQAVQRAMELESASQASLELNVSRRCLQRWKDELDVIASVAEHSSNAVYRRPGQGRKVHDSSLDSQLLEWLQDCWKQGVSVTSGMVRNKARELSNRSDFKASLGWFVKWQKRHNVDLKEQTCGAPGVEGLSPLKLRLLPEGELSCYSTPAKKRKTNKCQLSYDDEALLENDEEFDRQLLTWLVERWEAGDIVNDRMLKDRAMELTANPEFRASRTWLSAWKRKYNVSLENQTYGNDGDEENEEIIEETEVYDNEHLVDGQEPAGRPSENPLTPTKAEAATALASLSAEDAAGLEVAEALQKLANALGITTQTTEGDAAKQAMAQLTAAYQAENPQFLLEGSQVVAEEVVSEEVITDEPMVVIEASPVLEGSGGQGGGVATVQTTTTVVTSAAATEAVSKAGPTTVVTADAATATSMGTVVVTSAAAVTVGAAPLSEQLQLTPTPSTEVSAAPVGSALIPTAAVPSFVGEVTEEVVIGEPVVVDTSSTGDDQVEVYVQSGNEGIVVVSSFDGETSTVVAESSAGGVSTQVAPSSSSISSTTTISSSGGGGISVAASVPQSTTPAATLTAQQLIAVLSEMTSQQASSVLSFGDAPGNSVSDVASTAQQIVSAATAESSTELAALDSDIIAVAVQQGSEGAEPKDVVETQEVPLAVGEQELLDVVNIAPPPPPPAVVGVDVGGAKEITVVDETAPSMQQAYDDGFKAKETEVEKE